MIRRALFIAGAKSRPELTAGVRDCEKLHAVLQQKKFGGFESALSAPPLTDCASVIDYLSALKEFVKRSATATHRVVYFTGHGRVLNGNYGIEFDGDFLPFGVVTAMLQAQGPARTLFILDTCHSGAAELGGIKSIDLPIAPSGAAIFASSRDVQLSHEDDEIGSAFTHFLCECIESGNAGAPTTGALITVPDAIHYIQSRIEETGRAKQNPIYTVRNAETHLWIAQNISGATTTETLPTEPIAANDPFAARCWGATLDDLDAELLKSFAAEATGMQENDLSVIAKQLGLLTSNGNKGLSMAAVLCFGRRPSYYFPSSASTFSAGDLASQSFDCKHIDGPLVSQLQQLVHLTQKHLRTEVRFGSGPDREDFYEVPTLVLKEVIANALVHRDFNSGGRVQVHVDIDSVRISNPGSAPTGYNWADLLDKPGYSYSPNRRLANLLQEVRGHEGVGRGFTVLQRFRQERGEEAVSFEQDVGTVVCKLWRPPTTPQGVTFNDLGARVAQFVHDRANALVHHKDLFNTETINTNKAEGTTVDIHRSIVIGLATALFVPGALIALIGAAGSGKTHMLRRLFLELVARNKPSEVQVAKAKREITRVPIYAALRDVNVDLPFKAGLSLAIGAESVLIDYIFEKHDPILVLDGLDECVPAARQAITRHLQTIREMHPNISILVSSRQTTQTLIDPLEVPIELGAISKSDVRQIVESDLQAPMAQRFLQTLAKWDPSLTSNPLLLRLAIKSFLEYADFPNNIDDLIARAFDVLWDRHDATKAHFLRLRRSSVSQDFARTLLGRLALFFLGQHAVSIHYSSILRFLRKLPRAEDVGTAGSLFLEANAVLEDFVEIGILVQENEQISFNHRTFFEHFALFGLSQLNLADEDLAELALMLINSGIDVGRIVTAASQWPSFPSNQTRFGDILRKRALIGNQDIAKVELFLEAVESKLQNLDRHHSKLSDILGSDVADLPHFE